MRLNSGGLEALLRHHNILISIIRGSVIRYLLGYSSLVLRGLLLAQDFLRLVQRGFGDLSRGLVGDGINLRFDTPVLVNGGVDLVQLICQLRIQK